jgi:hypothetical protein
MGQFGKCSPDIVGRNGCAELLSIGLDDLIDADEAAPQFTSWMDERSANRKGQSAARFR